MFKSWPKIHRWENETYRVTEKIDGTNACVIIQPYEPGFMVVAQSRTRILTTDNDNFGFAKWVEDNHEELQQLGIGYHYGEWWGQEIQRHYGLKEKRFSLFEPWKVEQIPSCCHIVPEICKAAKEDQLYQILNDFNESVAAPGYKKPEGFVIHGNLSKSCHKLIKD